MFKAFTEPRQLERFWGPPGYPATFASFDLKVGGTARYHMTGPQGDKFYGAWEVLSVDEPREFTVIDRFVDAEGNAIADMPVQRMSFQFEATDEGTRMRNTSTFDSAEALARVVAMGAVEGTKLAMNQLDEVLQDLRSYAQGKGTVLTRLDDTHVKITRLVNGPRELVWRAHHEPELLKTWLLGPEGWEMTKCQVATEAGQRYVYRWAPVGTADGEPFGFEGVATYVQEPQRAVTTQKMTGSDEQARVNDLNLYEEDGTTLITLVIEYPDQAAMDSMLGTGMVDGMEASYARLEREVLPAGA